MSEEKEMPPRDFYAQHISTSGIAAGKNYRLFLGFLDSFVKSGFPKGTIEFTCPEIEDLKRQHTALLAQAVAGADAKTLHIAGLHANVAEENIRLMECVRHYAENGGKYARDLLDEMARVGKGGA